MPFIFGISISIRLFSDKKNLEALRKTKTKFKYIFSNRKSFLTMNCFEFGAVKEPTSRNFYFDEDEQDGSQR